MRPRVDCFQRTRLIANADHEWSVHAGGERAIEIPAAIAQPVAVAVEAKQPLTVRLAELSGTRDNDWQAES